MANDLAQRINDSGLGARSVNRLGFVIPSYVLLPTVAAGSPAPSNKMGAAIPSHPWAAEATLIERPLDLVDAERLEQVPFLHVVESFEPNAALHAVADLAGVVLAAFE
jgi:hypothetical protein